MPIPESPLKLARKALETRLNAIYQDLTASPPTSPVGVNWAYKSTMIEVSETRALGSVAVAVDSQAGDGEWGSPVTYDLLFRLMVANPDLDALIDAVDDHRYWFTHHTARLLQAGVEISWSATVAQPKTYRVFQSPNFYDEISLLEEAPDGGGINTLLWVYKWTDTARLLSGGFQQVPNFTDLIF